jgi:hypothetical protein
MRYKAKSIAALRLALGSLPDRMRVEVERRRKRLANAAPSVVQSNELDIGACQI